MPYKAAQFESAYRIAAVVVMLNNDRNEPEEVTLKVKYRPLSLTKLAEWDALAQERQTVIVKKGKKAEPEDKSLLARQLSEVVVDLDLVEDDGVTPKKVTFEYLETLDLGFLKDVQRVIVERAFPEKKEMMDLIRLKASSSGT